MARWNVPDAVVGFEGFRNVYIVALENRTFGNACIWLATAAVVSSPEQDFSLFHVGFTISNLQLHGFYNYVGLVAQ